MAVLDDSIVRFTAHHVLGGFYRQIAPLTTSQLERWLQTLGIDLRWSTLHQLWVAGLIHPVAIRPVALVGFAESARDGRFLRLDDNAEGWEIGDRGIPAEDVHLNHPYHDEELSDELRDALLWHPFSVRTIRHIEQALTFRKSPRAVLNQFRDIEAEVEFQLRHMLQRVRGDGMQSDELYGRKLLALLAAIEPLVHVELFHVYTVPATEDIRADGYFEWIDQRDGAVLLENSGLSLDEAIDEYRRIAFHARALDLFGPYSHLVRLAPIEERKLLKGTARLSQELYDQAALLRLYLGRYFGVELQSETSIGRIKAALYEDRDSYRDRLRRLNIDPQERVHWFVEGATELAFIEEWFRLLGADLQESGIALTDLGGKDKVDLPHVRAALDYYRRERIFAYASVDEDADNAAPQHSGVRKAEPVHVAALTRMASKGLLPLGFRVWCPDFVARNFHLRELATVATKVLQELGANSVITDTQIENAMTHLEDGTERPIPVPVEKAIADLWRYAGYQQAQKGPMWGKALAKFASDNPWSEEADSKRFILNNDERPITQLILMLMRARSRDTDYDMELERTLEKHK